MNNWCSGRGWFYAGSSGLIMRCAFFGACAGCGKT